MMPGSMQNIKRRMRSIQSTKKITSAMELVATSKLRKTRNQLENLKHYDQLVMDMTSRILIASETNVENKYLIHNNKVDKDAYIVISSSLGLCGGYNSNVLKAATKAIKQEDYIFTIGNKATTFFTLRQQNVNQRFMELNNSLDFNQLTTMMKELEKLYLDGKINRIRIVYTEFVNNLTFKARVKTLLPISKQTIAEIKSIDPLTSAEFIIFEPSADEVLNQLIPMYLYSIVYGYLIESVTSENASRRLSMENANDNAEELLENLKLKYNQARQTAITNEISEIIAGANA